MPPHLGRLAQRSWVWAGHGHQPRQDRLAASYSQCGAEEMLVHEEPSVRFRHSVVVGAHYTLQGDMDRGLAGYAGGIGPVL